MRHVVIMAGGSGTRLWPLSRRGEPKQLLPMIDGRSLLRMAYERVAGLVPDDHIYVVTGRAHLPAVASQLPELPSANLWGEPVGRDSMNAVAWSAAILDHRDPDAVVAMLSADAIMRPVEAFHDALDTAFQVAEADPEALITFGVVPTEPATGFGYLHRGSELSQLPGVYQVLDFAEKPDEATAQRYLDRGDYWWNAGMFCWRTSAILAALQAVLPQTYADVRTLAEHPSRLDDIFPSLHKISVDYAVMEPVSRGQAPGRVLAVPLPIDWHDVGTFVTLAEFLSHDESGNAAQGLVVAVDAHDNLIINSCAETVVAVSGITGMAIIATPGATLVVPLDRSDQIKTLVARVGEQAGELYA